MRFVFLAVMLMLAPSGSSSRDDTSVTFHSPLPNVPVSGRTLQIDLEVQGLRIPEEGKGILYLDGIKLLEVRQQRISISMDGAGGLAPGPHALRVDIHPAGGESVEGSTHTFIKEGDPEDAAGPFHDDRFDGEDLHEMEASCAAYASSTQVPDDPPASGTATAIALGLPIVSSKTKYDGEEEDDMRVEIVRDEFFNDARDHPMMTVFMPSLLQQLGKETGNYTYQLWLGFDAGDPLFDDSAARERISTSLERMAAGKPVTFHWVQYDGMRGKVFWIYNDLFRQAYHQGADYFYMVNDDILLVTQGWADSFTQVLRASPIAPNFGVAGPLDIRDRHKHHMCFAFHHRTHYEIFGVFYPPVFQNWWSDYWSSLVYGPKATFWLKSVQVRNTEIAGRRYPAYWEGSDMLREEVEAGRRRISLYCRCRAAGGIWRFEGCIFGQTA